VSGEGSVRSTLGSGDGVVIVGTLGSVVCCANGTLGGGDAVVLVLFWNMSAGCL
jgi:hypothetical protein